MLKACPRCQGDLRINRDFYGEYRQCVQCGYMKDLDARPSFSPNEAARARKKVA